MNKLLLVRSFRNIPNASDTINISLYASPGFSGFGFNGFGNGLGGNIRNDMQVMFCSSHT